MNLKTGFKIILILLIVAFCLTIVICGYKLQNHNNDSPTTLKTYLIVLKSNKTSIISLLDKYNKKIKIKYIYKNFPIIAVSMPKELVPIISKEPYIEFIEPDNKVYALGETIPWGVSRIQANDVWDRDHDLICDGIAGVGINISVLDTGIDYTHKDLSTNYRGGYDFVNNDKDPMDDNGHGTHVAGIIAAACNGIGIVGVSPKVNLYAVKVLNDKGEGNVSELIAGIDWSIDHNMNIIVMSLGSNTPSESLRLACDRAYKAGLLLVAAAGNDGSITGNEDTVDYPARYDSVIAVGAIDRNNARAIWIPYGASSTGPELEFVAPGDEIYSTLPGDSYGICNGTSMACPHVAGVAALIWSEHPEWNATQIREKLRETAEDLGTPGKDNEYGYGLVNAIKAVSPLIYNVKVSNVSSTSATISWYTDEVSDSLLKIGKEPDKYTRRIQDLTLTRVHIISVSGLEPNTVYYFVINSTDKYGYSTEYKGVFKTKRANEMHIEDISLYYDTFRTEMGMYYKVFARIKICDFKNNPVNDANVTIKWYGIYNKIDYGITNNNGIVLFNTDWIKASGVIHIEVLNIEKPGYLYNKSANKKTEESMLIGVIYVPDNFSRIQWAVNNASDCSTIIIRDGIYNESITVDKPIIIKSENGSKNCTVISNTSCFRILSNNVTISGITLKCKVGIISYNSSNINILDNKIANSIYGIYIVNSREYIIKNNTFYNNSVGIYLELNSSTIFKYSIEDNKFINTVKKIKAKLDIRSIDELLMVFLKLLNLVNVVMN